LLSSFRMDHKGLAYSYFNPTVVWLLCCFCKISFLSARLSWHDLAMDSRHSQNTKSYSRKDRNIYLYFVSAKVPHINLLEYLCWFINVSCV
jgi:hypothetical protein